MSRAESSTVRGEGWQLHRADLFELLPRLAACSVDAVVTDPPYGIGFHGERWDTRTDTGALTAGEGFERWTQRWAEECLRVLKPGGYLAAFGATRTAHRLAAGIEDAGFEPRDQLAWLYGTGVPKAPLHRGRSRALKPGHEPIVLGRKPLDGTLDQNERVWGTGRLGIDEARTLGRWPCNVTLTHPPACSDGRCLDSCPVGTLNRSRPRSHPSRFFYCPKPSRAERDAGCNTLPISTTGVFSKSIVKPRRNSHPTVKPVELMRWLIRLTCPPDGTLLDPFTGSGTTGIAALSEQRAFIGVERDRDYTRIARARLAHAAAALPTIRVAADTSGAPRPRRG